MPRDPEWDRLDAEDLAEAIAERLTPAHLEEHDLDYLTRDPYPWERTL